jgi:hypothetical protein
MADVIKINRAPVLTLWAAVVAEQLGFGRDEALTLARAIAGLNAYSKGVRLGLYEPTPEPHANAVAKRNTAPRSTSISCIAPCLPCRPQTACRR